jgi:hypothetical protein
VRLQLEIWSPAQRKSEPSNPFSDNYANNFFRNLKCSLPFMPINTYFKHLLYYCDNYCLMGIEAVQKIWRDMTPFWIWPDNFGTIILPELFRAKWVKFIFLHFANCRELE